MVKVEANGVGNEYFGGRIILSSRVIEFQKRVVGLCLAESGDIFNEVHIGGELLHSLTGKVCELRLPGLKAIAEITDIGFVSHMGDNHLKVSGEIPNLAVFTLLATNKGNKFAVVEQDIEAQTGRGFIRDRVANGGVAIINRFTSGVLDYDFTSSFEDQINPRTVNSVEFTKQAVVITIKNK